MPLRRVSLASIQAGCRNLLIGRLHAALNTLSQVNKGSSFTAKQQHLAHQALILIQDILKEEKSNGT